MLQNAPWLTSLTHLELVLLSAALFSITVFFLALRDETDMMQRGLSLDPPAALEALQMWSEVMSESCQILSSHKKFFCTGLRKSIHSTVQKESPFKVATGI